MKPTLVQGARTTATLVVDRERTIDFMGERARVYATPMLVRDIEVTCRGLILEHADPGEDSVGSRIELDHLAPTLPGMTVRLTVTIAAVDGRSVSFDVEGHDGVDTICRGRHQRFVVDVAKTAKRLEAKAAKAAEAARAAEAAGKAAGG
jgi:predicted thioesterase